ncbi:MAG: hypothetical protein M1594_01815 [Candidatus Marsarchaeota archaeon]|nr:hypothetical protein [Candidatus Marsarchaeota archaeon]
MDVLFFYVIIFMLIFIFTLASNSIFIIKVDDISKKFKSDLIKQFLKIERNVATSLLIVKLSISGFIIIMLVELLYLKTFNSSILDLDLIILLIGVILLSIAGFMAVSKTQEMSKEYGFE